MNKLNVKMYVSFPVQRPSNKQYNYLHVYCIPTNCKSSPNFAGAL